MLSSPAAAQQDPCNVREQWIRYILAVELIAGRMSLDQVLSVMQANASPACARYPGPPNNSRPLPSLGKRPYGRVGSVCTLPDGTSFPC